MMDERDKSLSAAVTLLRDELTRKSGMSHDVMQRLFDLVLTAIGRPMLPAAGSGAKRPLIDVRVARVLASLRESLSERWTIAKMAKVAGMSRAAFIRLFTATTGTPPLTYVTRLRIEVAQALLAETDEAAAVIAERVGYGSVYAFSRAFTRLTGKPPVLFRRTARGQCVPIMGRATMLRLAA
jgi:transcriptional regulator GlxA family with amidase domain